MELKLSRVIDEDDDLKAEKEYIVNLLYDEDTKPQHTAKIGLAAATTALGVLAVGCAPFLRRFTGAPYVSSSAAARRAISDALRKQVKPGGTIVDMGSGSGEILLDAAKHGFRGTGYELNVWLVALSRWRAWRAGAGDKVTFRMADMWTADLRQANAVVVFGIPDIMSRIKQKITSECSEGCLVCCNTFPIKGMQETSKRGGVWFYSTSKDCK